MELPLLEEIQLKNYNKDYLRNVFEVRHVGRKPALIILDRPNEKDDIKKCLELLSSQSPDQDSTQLKWAKQLVENFQRRLEIIEEICHELSISPRFPYPLYIMSALPLRERVAPLVQSLKDLPSFYRCPPKRPNNKETALLQKIEIHRERILGHKSEDLIKSMQEIADQQRSLFKSSKESFFYQSILKEWEQYESG